MANAKAKGIRIGRLKTRDSDLIRKLRLRGVSYREIARIAGCSSGAVSAEIKAMKNEKSIFLTSRVPTDKVKKDILLVKEMNEFEIVRF